MVNTKELRDLFDQLTREAGKRANEAISDMNIGRESGPPPLVWFGLGLALGAAVGMIAAFLVSPYSGPQARAKLAEQVEKVRKQSDDVIVGANGGSTYSMPAAAREQPLT